MRIELLQGGTDGVLASVNDLLDDWEAAGSTETVEAAYFALRVARDCDRVDRAEEGAAFRQRGLPTCLLSLQAPRVPPASSSHSTRSTGSRRHPAPPPRSKSATAPTRSETR